MRNTSLVLVLLLVVGCASSPERTTFADIAAKNETLKKVAPERVQFDFKAQCNEERLCYVKQDTLEAAAQIITNFNNEQEIRIGAYNEMVTTFSHCEFALAKQQEANLYLGNEIKRSDLLGTAKQLVTGVVMGALCIMK